MNGAKTVTICSDLLSFRRERSEVRVNGQTHWFAPTVGADRRVRPHTLTLSLSRKGRGNCWRHFIVN